MNERVSEGSSEWYELTDVAGLLCNPGVEFLRHWSVDILQEVLK